MPRGVPKISKFSAVLNGINLLNHCPCKNENGMGISTYLHINILKPIHQGFNNLDKEESNITFSTSRVSTVGGLGGHCFLTPNDLRLRFKTEAEARHKRLPKYIIISLNNFDRGRIFCSKKNDIPI